MANNTITIELPDSVNFGTKVAGEWLPVDLTKASNSFLVRFLVVGTQRHTNDKFSGLEANDKLDAARLETDAINNGEEWEGRSRGGADTMSKRDRLALSIAKKELTRRFKVLTDKGRIADMVAANDKVAAYFEGTTWIDAKVNEWIETQAASGKFDAFAQADKELAELAKLAETVDADDI